MPDHEAIGRLKEDFSYWQNQVYITTLRVFQWSVAFGERKKKEEAFGKKIQNDSKGS